MVSPLSLPIKNYWHYIHDLTGIQSYSIVLQRRKLDGVNMKGEKNQAWEGFPVAARPMLTDIFWNFPKPGCINLPLPMFPWWSLPHILNRESCYISLEKEQIKYYMLSILLVKLAYASS